LGAERAFLFLTDGARLIQHHGRSADGLDLGELVGYSASTVERVRRTGEPVVVTSTEDGEAQGADSVVLHGLRSVLAAPVQLDGRMLGIIYLDSRVAGGIFTPDDVGVLIAITNHIAVALETARAAQLEVAVATANRQRDLAETLRTALADIAGELEATPESVLTRLRETAARTVGGSRAWLVLGAATDPTAEAYGADGKAPGEVKSPPAALLASDVVVQSTDAALLAPGECSLLAVPLLPGASADGRSASSRVTRLGILLLASAEEHAFADGQA